MYRWLRRLFAGPGATPVPDLPDAPLATPVALELPAAVQAEPAPARPAPPPVSFEQLDRIDGAWNDWLFDPGQDSGGLELNDAETRMLDALAAIRAAQQSGAALVRRMPGLIPQLLQSLRSDTFSGSALARTISSDPVLVAAVVRLANGCQGGGNAISSVEHAVIVLGQQGLRQLVTTVAFRPIVDLQSGFYTRRLAARLWEHAERCATSARQVAPEAGVDRFDAFLAGLLQHVGMLAALRMMDQAARGERRLGSALFLARLARDTRMLSASIAREWHFPETVAQALLEQGELGKGAAMSPLGRLLKLAGYLGKVRMLVENGLLDEAEPDLFSGLPPHAAQCWSALAASRQQLEQA